MPGTQVFTASMFEFVPGGLEGVPAVGRETMPVTHPVAHFAGQTPREYTHMLPSQMKISASQATKIDLAEKSGIRLNATFELMGNEAGGRRFLQTMSSKAPKTIFTDQDVAMANTIPIVMPNTKRRLCTWHLIQNALRHANSIFKDKEVNDKGIKSVLSKFMDDIEDKDDFTLKWEEMLDKYEVRDNHWLKLTFGVKEKWGWPYGRNVWGAGMSSTQLSESFNAFLKDFIQSDHNLMQFFMHVDRVLCEKRYKEFQVEYALCQKLPRMNIKVKIMEQAADVYINKIYEKFQDEYVKSLEVNIEETKHDSESTVYTVLDSDGVKVRNVRVECDGSLTYNCRKFEMKGILCSHCLKILTDTLKFKEIHSQYILKRWTKKARVENVKDRCGHDIKVDPSFLRHNMPFSMPSMYSVHGSYQALLNNASGYDSQASNSPACSQVLHGHGRSHGRGHGHGHVDHTSIS
ncbi:protein FAR1-RELATED SEQUENCE 5-like [Camellia sinensis]|uniref:protein FAR1-RELATED SEQUENCE 5-like n=1 Tax=Camellia sinensis TaxID=4442 RepID=UPI0010359E7A|nr:protein FAR1-RELATED SEQUENCE 5-like [Camellia sinensis]